MANRVIITKDGELKHYGVKGMKWGVRKEYEPVGRKGTTSNSDKSYGFFQ